MTARKIESEKGSTENIIVQSRRTQLTLSSDAVHITKHGVEFRSLTPLTLWTEMTITLEAGRKGSGKIDCNGVVVGCSGNKHMGYFVSMLFTSLSKQSQARLNTFVSA